MKTIKMIFTLAAALFVIAPAQNVLAGGDKGDAAFTAWAIVFNNYLACVDGCGADDVNRPGVDGAVIFLTGQRVQSNGRAIFAGSIVAGSDYRQVNGTSADGLVNTANAEIHVVLVRHPKGSLGGDAASRHLQVTTPRPPPFAQAAIFQPGDGTGIIIDPANGMPIAGAAAHIDRDTDGVTISVDTRL